MECYSGKMAREITIDGSGRLVIPKDVRRSHHLEAGTRLTLVEEEDRLVLVPEKAQPRLIEKNGLLVVSGLSAGEIPDHRTLRRERINRQGSLD